MSDKKDDDFELMLDRFAHYLRSPLTSIKGAASVLKQTQVNIDEESKKELINIINDESERLNKVIEKLLWMARIEAGKLQVNYTQNNLLSIVKSVRYKLKEVLKKNKLAIDIPANFPLVPLDSELIEECLCFLLENCVKFSPAGSEILISACQIEDKVKISIIDKGCGIKDDKQEEIFSKFYRPPQQLDQLPSVGMSLAICKGLVDCHKGTIELKSKVGQGTKIDILLPISI